MERTTSNTVYEKNVANDMSMTILLEHRTLGDSATEIANKHFKEKPASDSDIAAVQIVIDFWHKVCTLKKCFHIVSFSEDCEQCLHEYLYEISDSIRESLGEKS